MTITIVVVVGNPRPESRTRAVGEAVAARLAAAAGDGADVHTIELADLGPALLEWGDEGVEAARRDVGDAGALVVASPTYKASYTGLLKCFLDQFDAGELGGVPTAAVMTGGNPGHALAVDVHLTPVLVEIGASCPARGLYVFGADQDAPAAAVDRWWETAARALGGAIRRTD
jgi:FMN reductase